jgi:hypothetical protein
MAQAQAQTQAQKGQLIRLSKSGKSYVYQGNYYKLDNKMYICENNTAFVEIYTKHCHQRQYLSSMLKFHAGSSLIGREYYAMLIKEMIHIVIIANRNYDKIFNHSGLGYRLVCSTEMTKPIMYVVLKNVKYVLRVLSNPNYPVVMTMTKQLRNQGIRETTLFIAMMSKHLAYHRKKMVNYLPRLLGHRIDDNVATIIYEYCM